MYGDIFNETFCCVLMSKVIQSESVLLMISVDLMSYVVKPRYSLLA